MKGRGGAHRGCLRAGTAGLVVAVLLVAGCTSDAKPEPSAGPSTSRAAPAPSADPAVARTTVQAVGVTQQASVTTPELTGEQRSGLDDLAQAGVPLAVGRPVEISLAGGVSPEGVLLSRTYPSPLPKGADAAFMFYDEDLSAWRAVPSTLSKDRRSVTATVHHLSLWTDIVSTSRASAATDWVFDTLGKLVDTRVEPPTCETGRPAWVSDVTYIETNKTNPVHFCSGKDPKQPGLLTIKARVNRGYGYRVATSAVPSWSHNSGADPGALQELWDAVADVDGTVTKDLPAMFGKGEYVFPGEELAIGVSEDSVRSFSESALGLQPVNGFGVAVGFLSKKVAGDVLDQAEGTVAAAVVLAGCADSLKDIRDVGTFGKATIDCVNRLDVRVAVRLAEAMQRMPGWKLDARASARLAGKVVGLVSILVEVAMPVFTYIADRNLDVSARQLHVFAKARPSINVLTQDGRMGPLKLGMSVDQAKAAIAGSGIKGLKVGRTDPEGGSLLVVKFGDWPVVGVFNDRGRLAMLMGTDEATIDGLRGMGSLAPFKKKYGSALKPAPGDGQGYQVVTFKSGVRLQLTDEYTAPGEVGQLILLAPGQPVFYGEFA